MRYRALKQAAMYREHKPAREAFLCEFCNVCAVRGTNCQRHNASVHEITRGKNRMRAFGVRAAWLPACGPCNTGDLDDAAAWPLAKQLALKLLIDPRYFSLDEIRRILAPEGCRNPPLVVTGNDVLDAMQQLLIERYKNGNAI